MRMIHKCEWLSFTEISVEKVGMVYALATIVPMFKFRRKKCAYK